VGNTLQLCMCKDNIKVGANSNNFYIWCWISSPCVGPGSHHSIPLLQHPDSCNPTRTMVGFLRESIHRILTALLRAKQIFNLSDYYLRKMFIGIHWFSQIKLNICLALKRAVKIRWMDSRRNPTKFLNHNLLFTNSTSHNAWKIQHYLFSAWMTL
jgi:hypothetical protein